MHNIDIQMKRKALTKTLMITSMYKKKCSSLDKYYVYL